MYSAFWFWPFAPWGSKNVASWLQEQLNQEPDLLAASYTQLKLVNVGAVSYTHLTLPTIYSV